MNENMKASVAKLVDSGLSEEEAIGFINILDEKIRKIMPEGVRPDRHHVQDGDKEDKQ